MRQQGHLRLAPDQPASTPFVLLLDPDFDRKATVYWQDDGDAKLAARRGTVSPSLRDGVPPRGAAGALVAYLRPVGSSGSDRPCAAESERMMLVASPSHA